MWFFVSAQAPLEEEEDEEEEQKDKNEKNAAENKEKKEIKKDTEVLTLCIQWQIQRGSGCFL